LPKATPQSKEDPRAVITMSPTGRDARETRNTENKSSGKALQNAA